MGHRKKQSDTKQGADSLLTTQEFIAEHGSIFNESFTQVLHVSPVPMALTTMEIGGIVEVNEPFRKLLRVESNEAVQKTAVDLGVMTPEDHTRFLSTVCEHGQVREMEIALTPRGGTAFKTLISAAVIKRDEHPYLLWMITGENARFGSWPVQSNTPAPDAVCLDEQTAQEKNLDSVGRLVGAIAHGFSSLISPIIGLADMGMVETEPGSSLNRDFEQIRDAALQANELTRQLLAFGRKQRLKMRLVNINDVVINSEKLLHRLIQDDIELEIRLHPSLGEVRADPTQLQQVLINLVLNGRDAMPHGGKMIIETANTLVHEEQLRDELGISPGKFAMLSVRDTGYGMDNATQSRVFEPFFTTKRKGQGMGLAMAFGIVKQHGGMIWIFSRPGEGSALKVCLPRADEKSKLSTPSPTPAPTGAPIGTETIVVVEDEAIVRRMVCRILETHGYNVSSAENGVEALELLESMTKTVHLLLTDVIMPKMNGKQLRDRVKELRPGTKVLYMSGYADAIIARHGVLDDNAGFLQKPFSLWDLTKKVREALDE